MNFQLHLVPAPTAVPAAAGWLPDANARSGLEEVRRLVESGAATADAVRIYTVSRPGSRLALGLVIVPPASGKPLADIFSSRVQLLGWCGPNVAAPVHSRLNGGLSNAEFSRYFPYHFQFFHPSGGIWAFEPQDALRPEDLLALPTILEQDWSLARPGLPPVPLLLGLGVAQEQSLDALMQSMADGIGADADKPESQSLLGKTGEKIGDALGLAGSVGMGILGGLMSGLFKLVPGGMAGQNLEKLRQWAAQNLKVLQNLRNRELDKLINLLEKNPEEGLRRALPLAGNGNDGGRGRATPSWHLGQRGNNWSFGSNSSGPSDVWDVEQRTRLLLEKKYREAANREMAAGRHGRAAYIFAHLLGDWASAANALEKDQRFREAADIQQKKLGNPRRAAVCLEAGGFYREAADFHLLAKDYEKAGDCLEKIGQFEEAARHFRTAVDAQPDRLVKARILEQKLRLPDEAVQVLESGIRSDGQAKRCLQALFQLLRRLDRPDAAHALMQRLEQPANQIPFPLVFVEALLETRKDCLREDTIALANNIVTDTAGRWISQNPHSQDNVGLLRLLRQVAPQDVLLKRDCDLQDLASRVRHTAQHRAAVAQPKGGLLPERTIDLPKRHWQSLESLDGVLSLVGWMPDKAWLTVGRYDGELIVSDQSSPVIHAAGTRLRQAYYGTRLHPQRAFHTLEDERLYLFGTNQQAAGYNEHRGVLACAGAGTELLTLEHTATSSLTVQVHNVHGALVRSYPIDFLPHTRPGNDWHIAGLHTNFWIAGLQVLVWKSSNHPIQTIPLDSPILALKCADPRNLFQAVICTATEAMLAIPPQKPTDSIECINLFSSTGAPIHAAITNQGQVAIVSGSTGVVWDITGGQCRELDKIVIPATAGQPIAVAAYEGSSFAILTDRNKLLIYQ